MRFIRAVGIALVTGLLAVIAAQPAFAKPAGGDPSYYSDRENPESPNANDPESGECEDTSLSDPVNMAIGEFKLRQTDIHVPGRGMDFVLTRSYRHRTHPAVKKGFTHPFHAQPFGRCWSHSYGMHLHCVFYELPSPPQGEPEYGVAVKLLDGNGRLDYFHNVEEIGREEGEFPSIEIVTVRVRRGIEPQGGGPDHDGIDGYFEIVFEEVPYLPPVIGTSRMALDIRYFTSDGREHQFVNGTPPPWHPYDGNHGTSLYLLRSITDSTGENTITLYYDFDEPEVSNPGDRLMKIVDTLGRTYLFEYDADAVPGNEYGESFLVVAIQELDGDERRWEYEYEVAKSEHVSREGHLLVRVCGPEAELGPHATGAERACWEFEYDEDEPPSPFPVSQAWEAGLSVIRNPNGEVTVRNEYSASLISTSNWSRMDYRLIAQEYGGERYLYTVLMISGGEGSILNTPYIKGRPINNPDGYSVWVNNRAGHTVRLDYDENERLLRRVDYTGIHTINKEPGSETSSGAIIYNVETLTQLRPGEEAYYIKDFTDTSADAAYNDDWRRTREVRPNGTVVESVYARDGDPAYNIDPETNPLKKGNLIRRTTTPPSGQGPAITERWVYNDDVSFGGGGGGGCGCANGGGKPWKYIDPEGNETEFEYYPSGPRYGLLKSIIHPETSAVASFEIPGVGVFPAIGAQSGAAVTEAFDYNDHGQLTSRTLRANGSNVRTDLTVYYDESDTGFESMIGFVKERIVDAGGLGLTTRYEYDARGNVTLVEDPNGNITRYAYNARDEALRILHPDGTLTERTYDLNGNLVREDRSGATGAWGSTLAQAEPIWTTLYAYDVLDHVTHIVQQTDQTVASEPVSVPAGETDAMEFFGTPGFVSTQYGYDANWNRTLVRRGVTRLLDGEGEPILDENDAFTYAALETTEFEYDGLDRLTFRIDAPGTSEELITRYDYDGNGNLTKRWVGYDMHPSAPSAAQVFLYEYDGLDRLVRMLGPVDPENQGDVPLETHYAYDLKGNRIGEIVLGEVEDGDGDPRILAQRAFRYDEQDRMIEAAAFVFDPAAQSPVGGPPSGWSEIDWSSGSESGAVSGAVMVRTRSAFHPDGSLHWTADPRANVGTYTYDTAYRPLSVMDAAGNTVELALDDNGNVMQWRAEELRPDSGTDLFLVSTTYDEMNRPLEVTDGRGNTTSYEYTVLGHRLATVDAEGDLTLMDYDGLGRLRLTVHYDGGETTDPVLALVETLYDAASRATHRIDHNGNATETVYDGRGRVTAIIHADETQQSIVYDPLGNPVEVTDPNGTLVETVYDHAHRPVSRAVTPATDVVGTTWEDFRHDDLGRVTYARNGDGSGAHTLVKRRFDALGRLLGETIYFEPEFDDPSAGGFTTSYAYDHASNLVETDYPGGRVVERTYDELNRPATITGDNGNQVIASFAYAGPSRLAARSLANGTTSTYTYTGITDPQTMQVPTRQTTAPASVTDYGFGQLAEIKHVNGDNLKLVHLQYFWTRTQAKRLVKDIRSWGDQPAALYAHDALDRLIQSDVYEMVEVGGFGPLGQGLDLSPYDSIPSGGTPNDGQSPDFEFMLRKNHVYDLDGANNRVEVSGSKGVLLKGEYAMVGDDAKMNRYSTLPGSGQVEERHLSYDLSGNLIGSEVDCLGDANGDHRVDTDDLLIWIAANGSSYPDEEYDPRADFNGDLSVDTNDLAIWTANNGALCGFFELAYDYRNRLVDVEVRHDGQQVQDPPMHRYGYDAFGRRVKKTTDVGTGEERTVYFIYGGGPGGGGWQLLEEWEDVPSEVPALNAMFVHSGLYVDDVVQMRRWNELEDAFEDFYYHCDDLSSVRALTDDEGELVELYDYHEYGLPTITDPNTIVSGRPALLASSAFGNPFLFTGRMYDAETRLYHYRTRQYEPRMGRFISVDSIGVWGDEANLGNGYAYVGNRPGEWVDPWGVSSFANPVGAVQGSIAFFELAGHSYLKAIAITAKIFGAAAVAAAVPYTVKQIEQIVESQKPTSIPIPVPGRGDVDLPIEFIEDVVSAVTSLAVSKNATFCKIAHKELGRRCKSNKRSCDAVPKGSPCDEYKNREQQFWECAALRYAISMICYSDGPDGKHMKPIVEEVLGALKCRDKYDDCQKSQQKSGDSGGSSSKCP